MQNSVLLVDDEPQVVFGIKHALRHESFRILTATSAEEALLIISTRPVDVVVSDQRMPGMLGSSFLAKVHKQHPDIIRIMLTGQFHFDKTVQAINEGEIFRLLKKPCSPALLSSVIQAALNRRDLEQESFDLLDSAHQLLTEVELEHYWISIDNLHSEGQAPLTYADADVESLMEKVRATIDLLEHHCMERREL